MTSLMKAEIQEQPEAVAQTLDALSALGDDIAHLGRTARAVVFYGRGSSDNAAVYGRYLVEAHSHRLGALGVPSMATHYGASIDLRDTLAVVISQSGETEEIVKVAEWARGNGARVLAVTNGARSRLASSADLTLLTRAGEERAVPATKTYTTQLAAMAVIAKALGQPDEDFAAGLARVPDAISAMLQTADTAEAVAQQLTPWRQMVVSGRGYVLTTAIELALKLEEACQIATLGLSGADLQHGPIALLDVNTPILIPSAASGPMLSGARQLAEAAAGRGAVTVGIGGDDAFAAACGLHLPGPALPEDLAPLALIVPGQLLVEALARAHGLDPDQPRTLSKVTQTAG